MKTRGVFQDLLSSRPEPLLQSAAEFPGRFDERALSLLRAIYNNSTTYDELLPEEQELVNQATMEFFQAPPKKQEQKQQTLNNTIASSHEVPKEEPVEGPTVDAFWWT